MPRVRSHHLPYAMGVVVAVAVAATGCKSECEVAAEAYCKARHPRPEFCKRSTISVSDAGIVDTAKLIRDAKAERACRDSVMLCTTQKRLECLKGSR